MADQLHIVSLGSSFAAGPGIHPQAEPPAARRSTKNYPHLLANALGARLTDLSSSGATLLNITTEPQCVPFTISKATFAPQISQIPDDVPVDIITITAGGNDFGYIGGIMNDEWDHSPVGKILNFFMSAVRGILSVFKNPEHEPVASTVSPEELAHRMGDTVDEIHHKFPAAHIFFVEYVAVLGTETKPGRDVAFSQERIDHHRNIASELQSAYEKVTSARSEWCTRVPMHAISQSHAIGSKENWVEGFSMRHFIQRGPMFHPNLKGMEAVASELVKLIKKDT